jgi:hypothetical protein
MKTTILSAVSRGISSMFVAVMAVVLVAQSPLHAQQVVNTLNEDAMKVVTRIKTEVERRLGTTSQAIRAVESSNTINSSTKRTMLQALNTSKKALQDFNKQVAEVKDLQSANELAKKVDAQYEQYASAQAASITLKDGDTQQETAKDLEKLADDAQQKIDEAGSAGKDVSALQEELKGIDQLIQTINGIIASIVALLTSLATGNFSESAVIFQTIIGQLGLNITSMDSAENGLTGIISGLDGIYLGTQAPSSK